LLLHSPPEAAREWHPTCGGGFESGYAGGGRRQETHKGAKAIQDFMREKCDANECPLSVSDGEALKRGGNRGAGTLASNSYSGATAEDDALVADDRLSPADAALFGSTDLGLPEDTAAGGGGGGAQLNGAGTAGGNGSALPDVDHLLAGDGGVPDQHNSTAEPAPPTAEQRRDQRVKAILIAQARQGKVGRRPHLA